MRNARRRCRSDGWLALKHNNSISKISRHDEVVLDDERRLLGVKDESFFARRFMRDEPIIRGNKKMLRVPFDDFTGNDTLLGIEETVAPPPVSDWVAGFIMTL